MPYKIKLAEYARSTSSAVSRLAANPDLPESRKIALGLIDGEPSASIVQILGRGPRKQDGIYFSGADWAGKLIAHVPEDAKRFLDPACGVGDLLLALAQTLPLGRNVSSTLRKWGEILLAQDLHAAFTTVAWNRIHALALNRHWAAENPNSGKRCGKPQGFSSGNALASRWSLKSGDCVVMNPPFQRVVAPDWSWMSSRAVTASALFLEKALLASPPRVTILAILPDVIRSGSSFERLRALLDEKCVVKQFSPEGNFGGDADIDVAILVARTSGRLKKREVVIREKSALMLGSLVSTCVGSIVPHRAKSTTEARPYLTVPAATPWQELHVTDEARLHGRAHMPPFVVVRRTSSPADRERAIATIVLGDRPVIVENHLIVLLPKDNNLNACRRIVNILKDRRTSAWLNERIRCRHLTVSSIQQIPDWLGS